MQLWNWNCLKKEKKIKMDEVAAPCPLGSSETMIIWPSIAALLRYHEYCTQNIRTEKGFAVSLYPRCMRTCPSVDGGFC